MVQQGIDAGNSELALLPRLAWKRSPAERLRAVQPGSGVGYNTSCVMQNVDECHFSGIAAHLEIVVIRK